ncbi:hypothetical protein EV356DRAFT_479876 [Viridothelium virens]|uniref:NTF2 domain-containing protein n=1 Tax=Viridothelium virens TaxID=1048519 RepID=A0A6A6HIU6_VIRVR|nr:hypothetical protein EV356DRAFT_479876 [Viridothelium virens]
MSLSDKYHQFLSSPTTVALSDQASIIYIPTLTTITEPNTILKHLAAQEKLLKKKNEKVLSTIESDNGVCLDIETTIEFVRGGGTYLLGLDDNFLADRTVTFPMIHIVQFDTDRKIQQVRLYWDQGSLLKQLDIIGSRGRNWPIRDGKDQARLISSSAAGIPRSGTSDSTRSTSVSNGDPNGVTITTRAKSNSNAMNDPHASLSLFAPPEPDEEGPDSNIQSPSVARRMSAKPPLREYSELFGGEDEAVSTPTPAAALRERSASPSKRNAIPIKRGAGKNFTDNRLFDENDEPDPRTTIKSPERIKTDARKYNHFEFGDEEDTSSERKERPKSSHVSHWDFEDFVTPQKSQSQVRPNDQRHFGWSDDEGDTAPSVPKRPVIHQPRPDAKPHFEFCDEDTPVAQKTQAKTHALNKGLGLYDNHVTGADDTPGTRTNTDSAAATSRNGAGGPLTEAKSNINAGGRRKDFAPHWKHTDSSPAGTPTNENGPTTTASAAAAPAAPAWNGSEPPKKTTKALPTQMQSHWSHYDVSPEQVAKKPQTQQQQLMEAKGKENERVPEGARKPGRVMKQTERSWDFGDGGNGEEAAPIDRRGRGASAARAAGGERNFWDFE